MCAPSRERDKQRSFKTALECMGLRMASLCIGNQAKIGIWPAVLVCCVSEGESSEM